MDIYLSIFSYLLFDKKCTYSLYNSFSWLSIYLYSSISCIIKSAHILSILPPPVYNVLSIFRSLLCDETCGHIFSLYSPLLCMMSSLYYHLSCLMKPVVSYSLSILPSPVYDVICILLSLLSDETYTPLSWISIYLSIFSYLLCDEKCTYIFPLYSPLLGIYLSIYILLSLV